jgi:hypothetical protein
VPPIFDLTRGTLLVEEADIVKAEKEFVEATRPVLRQPIEQLLTPPSDEPVADIDIGADALAAALTMRKREVIWLRVVRSGGETVGFLNEQHLQAALSIVDEVPFMSEQLLAKLLPVPADMGAGSAYH